MLWIVFNIKSTEKHFCQKKARLISNVNIEIYVRSVRYVSIKVEYLNYISIYKAHFDDPTGRHLELHRQNCTAEMLSHIRFLADNIQIFSKRDIT